MNNDKPLVSICVITYNSSTTILETLESIKKQTYNLIELIISDDASIDNTVEICKQWLDKNRERFVYSKLICVKSNTGVPTNANRAVKSANGEWIKLIAGDDYLETRGIENFINQCSKTDLIVECQYKGFSVDNKGDKIYNSIAPTFYRIQKYYKSANEQYKDLLYDCFIDAPSIVIHKSVFDKVGYFDESYRLMEDYPFWIKCTSFGIKISYLPILLVYYRLNSLTSISNQQKKFFNEKFHYEKLRLAKEIRNPNIPFWKFRYWDSYYNELLRFYICTKILNNKKTKFNRFVHGVIFYTSIFNIYNRIKKFSIFKFIQ